MLIFSKQTVAIPRQHRPLNQVTSRTNPSAIDVVGEAPWEAAVAVNGSSPTRQGKYFHRQIAVNNASQPVYLPVTVTANKGTSSAVETGNVFVPRFNESFSYDADGNLTQDGRWAYTWDGENRLIGMESVASVPVVAKRKLSFAYDYLSRRSASRTQLWDAGASAWAYGALHQYVYDGWNLVAELVDGVRVSTYVWGLDLSGTMQGAGGVGGLLSVSQRQSVGGPLQTSYAIPDANGNVMMLVDAQTLETAAEYEYGPFGELIRRTGPRAKENPFRFSSKYQDEESGLLYYGYRYYDANTGRWLSRDPIGEKGGQNVYCFASNSPTGDIDFLGLWGEMVHNAFTKAWAQTVGIPLDTAILIGAADESVDHGLTNPLPWGDQAYHFNLTPKTGQDTRMVLFWKHFRAGLELCSDKKDTDDAQGAAEQLGIALHPLQDFIAHGDYGHLHTALNFPVSYHHNIGSPQKEFGPPSGYPDDVTLDATVNGSPTPYGIPTQDALFGDLKGDYAFYVKGSRRINKTREVTMINIIDFKNRMNCKPCGNCARAFKK